jgi:hypothetical protein
MAAITIQYPNGPYEPSSDATPLATLNWTACNTGGDTATIPGGKKLLLIFRNSGSTQRTVTIPSSYDPYGRKADIGATNIAAGVILARWFEAKGWETTLGSGQISFTANHAEIVVAAIAI